MLRHLGWLQTHAPKMEAGLRHHIYGRLRPPTFLPGLLHGLWHWFASRLKHTRVLVELADGSGQMEHLQRSAPHLRVRHQLDLVGCLAVTVRLSEMPGLCACASARYIWPDAAVSLPLPAQPLATVQGAQTEDPARAALQLQSLHSQGLTGAGITVAVIDTGAYPHPDLHGRISEFVDLVRGRQRPYDDNGHGTHVAGLVVGSGAKSGGAYMGSAPDAELVVIKALNRLGSGQISTLIAAIQWVVLNSSRLGIRVLSMSLGGSPHGSADQDPMARAVTQAWLAGLVVTCAAGNEGPSGQTIASPGIAPAVITVGAMDDHATAPRADDTLAPFSSRGPTPDGRIKPDIIAPGTGIVSLRSSCSVLDWQLPDARVDHYYTRLSGTSMATPLVAGVCACLVQQHPDRSPDQLKEILLSAAQDWGLPPNEQGAGYLNCALLV